MAGSAFARGASVLAAGFLAMAPGAAEALPLNPLDWTAGPFLALYAGLALSALVAAVILRDRLRRAGAPALPASLDIVEIAYLAGGAKRAADTVVIGLVDAGAASLGIGSGRVTVEDQVAPLPRHLEPFRGAARGTLSRSALLREIEPSLEAVRRRLVRAGLSPSDARLRRITVATLALPGPVILFGLAKAVVGLGRDKPVGILVVLTILTAVLGAVVLWNRPIRTEAGDAALDRYRRRHQRAARAPRARGENGGEEVLIAFALGGAVALAGTPYEAYGRAMRFSGGDGGSGCGSGGDGGGGGGCGGCGGGGD